MTTEYKFEEEWNENTNIEWWNEGRKKLNVAIRQYNDWQIEGKDERDKKKLLARIEFGMQTYGQRNGGSEWLAVLERMKKFVEEN